MPNTQGFEIVSEVTVQVLREILNAAWKSADDDSGEGVIPEKIEIPPGLPFGPYQLKEGTVQIPKEELGLEMATDVNGIEIKLGTIVHVEIDNPPIPSATFFDLTADVKIKVPIVTLEGDVNVGVALDNLPDGAVDVQITSGDPIGPITAAMVEEYIHEQLRNNPAFPNDYTIEDIAFLGFSMDAYTELYDDASDAAKTAKVTFPNVNQVKIEIPTYMRFYNIEGDFNGFSLQTPMGILGTTEIISAYSVENNKVIAPIQNGTITLTNITPAPGIEGTNYSTNKTLVGFVTDLDTVIATHYQVIGQQILNGLGPVEEDVPSLNSIEDFIAEEVTKELATRKQILIWEPAPPDDADVTISDVTIKAMNEGMALALNRSDGANADALSFFVPADRDFSTAISAAKVLLEIDKAVQQEFGNLPTTLDDKVEGKTIKLNSLDISLKTGAIDIEGSVTVVDAILDSIDVDADFDADSGLRWIDGEEGGQIIEPFVIGTPDVSLSPLVYLLGFLIGFVTFGIVGAIIVTVVVVLAENLAESIGAAIIKDDISDQLKGIGAWPQNLTDIGEITARFENPIAIDSQSIVFSGTMLITSMHALTSEDFARSNGPYFAIGNQALMFIGGAEKATSETFWDFGDGNSNLLRNPSHIYGKSGLYIAKLRIAVNEEGGVTTRHFTEVSIENVVPQVFMPANTTIDEGEETTIRATFIDVNWLDTHTALIDWGDNTAPEPLLVTETNEAPQAQGEIFACHAYCDNGEYHVRLIVRDDVGGIGEGTMVITVENVPPEVYLEEKMYSLVDQCVRLEGQFTDPGWCDTHTGIWNLGECDTRDAFIEQTNEPPQAEGTAKVAHSFKNCGVHQVSLEITDDDFGMGRDTMIVDVNQLKNAMLEDGFYTLSRNEDEMSTIANHWLPYAAFTTQNPDGQFMLDYTYEIGVLSQGQRSQQITIQGPLQAGIRQKISVNPGWDYEFTIRFHCETRTGFKARIGIDTQGGINPNVSTIVWRESAPGVQWKNLTVRATAQAETITLYVGAIQYDFNDRSIYIDETALFQIQPHCPLEACTEQCIDFSDLQGESIIQRPFQYKGLYFIPPENGLFMSTIGEPQGINKLGFHNAGMRIKFPQEVDKVTVTITNFAGRLIAIETLLEDEVITSYQEIIYNETRTILITENEMINGLVIQGGDSEAALVEICLCMPELEDIPPFEEEIERPENISVGRRTSVHKNLFGASIDFGLDEL